MPWNSKDAKRHTKKANTPRRQRQWSDVSNSALSRGASEGSAIRQANAVVGRGHAKGGALSALSSSAFDSPMHMKASMPKLGIGTAKMRMPRVPIADTLRNVNQSIHGAQVKLPKLKAAMGGKTRRYDVGGEVRLGTRAISALKDALSHLANKDASSAAAVLRSSPEALTHPDVKAAVGQLRASTGIAPATKSLTNLVNQDTERNVLQPSFRRGGRARGR